MENPMNYAEAIAYLDGFINLERGPLDRAARSVISLDSVRALSHRLGDPQRRFASLHVAGTKGKGSTCAFAASILREHGLHAGLYTSPHLEDVRERIAIDGEKIPEADFARILDGCRPALEELKNAPAGERRPTYFEILTHLAFSWFAEKEVDAAVVEVGLGGRLDATSIVQPAVCGITHISLDHTAILGDTVELIAREKAGIFKAGIPAVVAPQSGAVAEVLKECARNAGACIEFLNDSVEFKISEAENASNGNSEWPLPRAWARFADGREFDATLGLRGSHQLENWALALRLAQIFLSRQRGETLDPAAVAAGSRSVNWPGRLELFSLSSGVTAVLDGAHNVRSLTLAVNEFSTHLGKRRPRVCLFGCARDKDASGMLKAILESRIDFVVFTDSGNPRSYPPEELATQWREVADRGATFCRDSAEGFTRALEQSGETGAVLVTGSLYLVGKLRAECVRLSAPKRI
jgi:dihydrofolate synthase/folylpolyglutamate synthase